MSQHFSPKEINAAGCQVQPEKEPCSFSEFLLTSRGMNYVHTPCSRKSCLATRAALVGLMRRKGPDPSPQRGLNVGGIQPPLGAEYPLLSLLISSLSSYEEREIKRDKKVPRCFSAIFWSLGESRE